MLEYTQQILEKVSFDPYLFRKELIKALRRIKPSEKQILLAWCLAHYGSMYHTTISQLIRKLS